MLKLVPRATSTSMHPQIARACNYFEDFGLIPDEAIDVPTHEQVSVCVRFVESTCGNVILREEFLGFISASETTFENLAELFYLIL
jgi:hypothetical protein